MGKTTGEGDQVWFFMDDSYWFLTALFMARILYWLLRCYIKKECYVGLAALVIMLIGFFLNHIYDGVALDPAHYNNHLHYRNALCMMIFIWIGEYLKNHKEKLKKYFAPASIAYVVFILMSHLIGRFGAPVYAHSCNIPYHRIPLYLFYATIGSVCFLWIAWKIKANKVLEYLGKGSLVVYICHFGYLRVVIKFLPLVLSPYEKVSGFIFFFITLLLVALLCAATIWVLNHKYLKVLIGKF